MVSEAMDPPLVITEILGRSEQGITRPFVCVADHFRRVYAKGAYAGRKSLCCEWVANRLAGIFLPDDTPLAQPFFHMANVPKALVRNSVRPDLRDLGEGLVFASERVFDAQELTWSAAQGWSGETMALLLLLDLWLQNGDRTLSELGGNPNLLVEEIPPLPDDDPEEALWKTQPRRARLWVYDFNLAFEEKFDREQFFDTHVFGQMVPGWPSGFRERMEPRLQRAVEEVSGIFSELPPEWLYPDADERFPAHLSQQAVVSLLQRPFTEPATFWSLP